MSVDLVGFVKWAWTALLPAAFYLWKHLADKHKELKEETLLHVSNLRIDTERRIGEVILEVNRQRDISAKIFDKLEDMSKESADRHERLLNALHLGLNGKVDK